MAPRYDLTLSKDQIKELTQTRDHHPLAYLRVKAASLLKVAHLHSPEPLYDQRLADITNARILAQRAPKEVIFLIVAIAD